jgi:DNA-binding LacI/PurR family transcriptional regulator
MRVDMPSRRRDRSNGPNQYCAIVTVGQTLRHALHIPVLASFVAAVSEAAQKQGLSVLLDELPRLGGKSRFMQKGEIGGAILLVESRLATDSSVPGMIRQLADTIPLVWALGNHSGPLVVDRVAVDSQTIGQMAATYFAQRGCKRLAFIVDSPKLPWVRSCAASFVHTGYDQGTETFLYVVSDDVRDSKIFGGQVIAVRNIHECVSAMTAKQVRPDGIFGLNNELTSKLYPLLSKAGLAPGRDVSFVTCDNDSSRTADISPKPTTIAVNTAEVAARTVRRLLVRMSKPHESPLLIQVPPILVNSQASDRPLPHNEPAEKR